MDNRSDSRIYSEKLKINIYNDLLQIVINTRLGKEINLKARDYGKDYIIDTKNKIVSSPGSNSSANTKDDISLPINPEVLHLSN